MAINNNHVGIGKFTAIGDLSPQGFWSVICYRCMGAIGTMTPDTLQRAIMATAHKGGVLCPQCRIDACPQCYSESENGELCSFCNWQNSIQEKKALLSCVGA